MDATRRAPARSKEYFGGGRKMAPPSRLPLRFFLLLLLTGVPPAVSSPISLPLRRLPLAFRPRPAADDADPSLHRISALASASALRASLLKSAGSRRRPPPSSSPLLPHSYGGYSVTVAFGSPPQPLPLLLDTGSHLTWLPCTSSYQCRRCASSQDAPIVPFLPRSSNSSRLVGCRNPKCLWIHSPDFVAARCQDGSQCSSNSTANATSCGPKACPPYALLYGSGSTAGLLLLETLSLPNRTATDFTVGCSVFSDSQPAGGIAAFGRSAPSMPSQLGLRRFSYCLISRRFDDEDAESGSVILDPPKEDSSDGLSFGPFLRNPAGDGVFSVYYYVGLNKITVGGKKVRLPSSALVPGADGNGGAIVDSGTTFTYMSPEVFDPLATALVDKVAGRYNRSAAMEQRTGLRPCFALPPGDKEVELPKLAFHFKGGAEMQLPLENYFVFAGRGKSVVCLTIVSDTGGDDADAGAGGDGPAIILGSFQQQDYYVVYDLERERLGFRRQSCLRS